MAIKLDLFKGNLATTITEKVVANILDQIVTRQSQELDFKHLQRYLTNTITKAYVQAIRYAQKNMIGRASRGTSINIEASSMGAFSRITESNRVDGMQVFGRVNWSSLSTDHVKNKGNNKFFVQSGRLVQYLADNAEKIVKRTGVVKVSLQTKPRNARGQFTKAKRTSIGNLHIRVMPKIPASLLPGVATGNIGTVDKGQGFEQMVIGDRQQFNKLNGPGGKAKSYGLQRPLLQPVFTYWSRFYIPSAIRKGIGGTT